MTATTDTSTTAAPSAFAQIALQAFIEQDRTRVLQARKDRKLRLALRSLDLSDESTDLAWYYAETQKIMESNDEKIAVLESDL